MSDRPQISMEESPVSIYRVYTLKITREDLARVRLDPFDQMLIDDVNTGEPSNTPVADILLALETLTRRIEEQS